MSVGFVIAYRTMPDEVVDRNKSYDVPEMVLMTALLASALGYTQIVDHDFDMFGATSYASIAAMIVLCVALYVRSRHAADPAFPIHMSRMQAKMVFLMFAFSACGLGLVQYFFKFYLLHFEFNIYNASPMFLFLLAGGACTSLPGCRMVHRTGARPWVACGAVIVAAAPVLTHFIADESILCMGSASSCSGSVSGASLPN